MTRRNILFFVGNMALPGGTEQVTATVASGLQCAGHDVTILSMHGGLVSHFPIAPGVRLRSVLAVGKHRSLNAIAVASTIRRTVRELSIDTWVDAESVLAATSIPALIGITHLHVTWENFNAARRVGSLIRPIARRIAARYADRIVVLTELDKTQWQDWFKPNAQIIHVPNVLNQPVRDAVARSTPATRQRTVVATGRLANQKGFDLLLQAWVSVCKKHPDWKLRIVGDGPDRNELHALAIELGVARTVEWAGFKSAIVPEYQQASVFCLSSRFEGFGLVIIEAMATGLPVVSFDCDAGPGEIVKHEQTGLLAPAGDVSGLASALDRMLSDPKLRQRMGDRGQIESQRYTWENQAAQWDRVVAAPS